MSGAPFAHFIKAETRLGCARQPKSKNSDLSRFWRVFQAENHLKQLKNSFSEFFSQIFRTFSQNASRVRQIARFRMWRAFGVFFTMKSAQNSVFQRLSATFSVEKD